MTPIVIIGIGGHAQEIAWLIDDINAANPKWALRGFIDPIQSGKTELYGRPVLGHYDEINEKPHFVCGMGAPAIRLKESQHAESLNWQPATLIHPSVIQAKFVTIDPGTTIAAGVILGPYAKIGRHCFLNTHVSIGHNATLGEFNIISPGARVLGNATLAHQIFIGANATIYPGCKIGTGATLAANSFLHSHLAPGCSAIGVPARVFHKPK